MSDRLLHPLDPAQRAAASCTSGPIAILAVAGAGKTRTIAHRIAYAIESGAQAAEQGLAIAYSTKAAAELRTRLSALGVAGVTTATLHAVALRQLNYFWPTAFGGSPWQVLSRREPQLRAITEAVAPDLEPMSVRDLIAEVEWAKATGFEPHDYLELGRSRPGFAAALVSEVWGRYEDWLASSRQIDFDDVLQLLAGLLETRPDLAAEVHRRYSWFTVDEFQDITPLQANLIMHWLGDRADICVVGDPAQSIYEFAGASPRLLMDFNRRFPSAALVQLAESYRCAPEIAALANAIGQDHVAMQSSQPSGTVEQVEFADAATEAGWLVDRIKALLDAGTDPREIGVLVRIGAQTDRIERALQAYGIPVSSRPADRFFDHPIVKRALLILRAWSDTSDHLQTAIEAAAIEAGWSATSDDQSVWQAGSALLALADDLLKQQPGLSAAEFADLVEQRAAALDVPRPRAVQVLTMHSAKGLEWENVFLPELSDRLLPYPGASVAAERNLLYVAVTRAKARLWLSWSRLDERGRATARTRLLGVAGPAAASFPVAQPAAETPTLPEISEPVAVCRLCGRGLATVVETALLRCRNCKVDGNEALLEVLRNWRRQTAAARGIAEWLLVSDLSLRALAELQPRSLDELAKIHGFAAGRLDDFGNDLLQVIARS